MTAPPEAKRAVHHLDGPPPQPHARTTGRPQDNRAGCHATESPRPPRLVVAPHQIPPVGPVPNTDEVFVGALLYAAPDTVGGVLAVVDDDDLESPALAIVVAAIRRLAGAGRTYGPQLVLDELRRCGHAKGAVLEQFQRTWTTGAAPEAARDYGAAVVASRLRRLVESAGHALTAAASDAAETDIAALAEQSATAIRAVADRLHQLRHP